MPWSFTQRYVFASAAEPIASATSPTRPGSARSFMAILLSRLDPAKEPESRGTVFGFDLLGVRHDDRPDAPQLGHGLGVIVDAEVVVHARLSDRRHQERRRLLGALVTAGGLPRLE